MYLLFADYVQSIPQSKPATPPYMQRCASKVHIIFVIDSSSSIGRHNFERVKLFLIGIIRHLTLSRYYYQIGLVTFSERATVHLKIGDIANKAHIELIIKQLRLTRGTTNPYKAFKTVGKSLLVENISKTERRAKTAVLFVSNGGWRNVAAMATQAKQLQKMGIDFIAVGIDLNKDEMRLLREVASNPKELFFLHASHFTQLEFLTQDVLNIVCKGTLCVKCFVLIL